MAPHGPENRVQSPRPGVPWVSEYTPLPSSLILLPKMSLIEHQLLGYLGRHSGEDGSIGPGGVQPRVGERGLGCTC